MKALIVYKFVRSPATLALAFALTFSRGSADAFAQRLFSEIAEWGAAALRVSEWLRGHVTAQVEGRLAVVAWIDGVITFIEGALLYSGRAWGEWIVVAGLAVLLPFEAFHWIEAPSWGRAGVFVLNALVVAYLVNRRLQAHQTRARPGAPR